MKKLFILRHAKSSWDNSDLSDFERPLNEHGLKTAPFMGEVLRKNNINPDLILSSPAKRAKQTAILVKESGKLESSILYEERVYEAGALQLFHLIEEISDEFDSLLLVGHNPGLEGLIRVLTDEAQTMPTAALAIINLEISRWNELQANCGFLQAVIRPKEELKKHSVD